ncbi:hypothetical protein GJAV_G00264140 [Gymnothorax javanicus]|nr:hypothetical protein GJAV_G00264140 [Gymnothorax javanicus]
MDIEEVRRSRAGKKAWVTHAIRQLDAALTKVAEGESIGIDVKPTDYLTFNLAISDASISVFGYSRSILEIFNVFQDNGYIITSIWTCQDRIGAGACPSLDGCPGLGTACISVFGYSRGILEIFNVFQDNGYIITSIWTCQIDGFCTLLFGLTSINTLTVISITRYIKGCHPNKAHLITNGTISFSVVFIWAAAAFWSGAPLFGWGSFTDRGYGTCEVDWSKANYSTIYKSYIILILIFGFFIPVLIMLFSYVSIINTVKKGNALSAEGDITDRQRKMERDVTVVSIVICTAFILAWSPYAVVSMWSAWGFNVPGLTSIFTRLFAKSASFYNPLIYFGLSSKFRKDVNVLLPCTREGKDTVKLKRFKPKPEGAPHATDRPRAPPQQKYQPKEALKPSPSPPVTPPPNNKEVFFLPMPSQSEPDHDLGILSLRDFDTPPNSKDSEHWRCCGDKLDL